MANHEARFYGNESAVLILWRLWTCSIDMKDTNLHVLIHPASYRCLRLAITPTKVYYFRALLFGLKTAPLWFIWIVESIAGYMRRIFSLHVHMYMYLDNWFLCHQHCETPLKLTPQIVEFLHSLGWEVNLEKLSPSQSFGYLGLCFHADLSVVRPLDHLLDKLQRDLMALSNQMFITPRKLQALLGMLNFFALLVVLGSLHPLQFCLTSCWDLSLYTINLPIQINVELRDALKIRTDMTWLLLC